MPEAPYVRLNAGGPVPEDLFTRTPEQALIAGMLDSREYVLREARQQIKTMPVINPVSLTQLLDALWRSYLPTFRRTLVGAVAGAYGEGYRKAQARDIDPVVLNALAEQFSDRVGNYWHQSSREALVGGFNTYVNRKVPARAAADKVLEAYGLTPRQMGGFTSAKFDSPIESAINFDVKRRMRDYIGSSIRQRLALFATQESHNLDQEAQQMAWLYMTSTGQISENAEKVWLTAKDERVCPSCGPMHGKRAKVNDKFKVGDVELWTPGVHVNCRCEVRLVMAEVTAFGKDEKWYETDEARTSDGRFATRRQKLEAQAKNPRYTVRERTGDGAFQELLDQMFQPSITIEPTEKPKAVSRTVATSKPKAVSKPKATSKPKAESARPETKSVATTRRQLAGSRKGQVDRSRHLVASRQAAVQSSILEAMKVFKDVETSIVPPQEPKRVRVRNTVKLPRPVFTVMPAYLFDVDGQVQFNRGEEWYADEHRVAMYASEMFNDEISNTVEQIYDAEDIPMTVITTQDGVQHLARIAEEDIYELVGNTAWEGQTQDKDWNPDSAKYELEIQDELTGEWVDSGQSIGHHEAQELFGIHPEMFQVIIVKMEEGYDDPKQGRTYMDQAGSTYGHETWVTEGTYGTVEAGPTHHVDMRTPPIRTVSLVPLNIEEEILESAEDDMNEWHE